MAMARLRGQVANSKKHVKHEYSKLKKTEKRAWARKYESTGNFDWVKSSKRESKKKRKADDSLGKYLTEDGMLTAEGWTPENAQSDFGLRAQARAKAIVEYCKKVGGEMIRRHSQHGETTYKRLEESVLNSKEHTQEVATEMTKEGEAATASSERGMSSEESSSSSDSHGDSSDDEDDQPKEHDEEPTGPAAASAAASDTGLLGECICLKEKLRLFDETTQEWLKPWASQLKNARDMLTKAADSLLKGIAKKLGATEMETVREALAEGTRMYNIISPVHQSMEMAKEKLQEDCE